MGTDFGEGLGFWPLTPDPSPPAEARGNWMAARCWFFEPRMNTDEHGWVRIFGEGFGFWPLTPDPSPPGGGEGGLDGGAGVGFLNHG